MLNHEASAGSKGEPKAGAEQDRAGKELAGRLLQSLAMVVTPRE